MSCCSGGNNRKVKEWGDKKETKIKPGFLYIILIAVIIGFIIYKFVI